MDFPYIFPDVPMFSYFSVGGLGEIRWIYHTYFVGGLEHEFYFPQ
jgi:hypothetical protein